MGSDSTGCPASNSPMLPWRLCLLLVPRAYSCGASVGVCCGEWRHNLHASIRVNTHATGLLRGGRTRSSGRENSKKS